MTSTAFQNYKVFIFTVPKPQKKILGTIKAEQNFALLAARQGATFQGV